MNRLIPILTLAALSTLAAAQAPIERQPTPENARHYHAGPRTTQPAPGIRVTTSGGALENVKTDAQTTELRLAHGMASVAVDNPAEGALILVDLPGGQADLLKDGFYSLNADTNTLTVLRGEADIFALGAPADAKGITVKEGESVVLGANARPHEATRAEMGTRDPYHRRGGDGFVEPGWDGYGGYGYYGEPYGYGYPYYGGWGWDYPYYGYGWGLGFGYGWGGWGGYRGGFGGYRSGGFGFRGGRR